MATSSLTEYAFNFVVNKDASQSFSLNVGASLICIYSNNYAAITTGVYVAMSAFGGSTYNMLIPLQVSDDKTFSIVLDQGTITVSSTAANGTVVSVIHAT